jgi:hypothetical protein
VIAHGEVATDLLESIHLNTGDVYDQSDKAQHLRLTLSQVHATLHLAEQTRLANLLVAFQSAGWSDLDRPVSDPVWESARLSIREGLGVA